jgi:hypothetical protein
MRNIFAILFAALIGYQQKIETGFLTDLTQWIFNGAARLATGGAVTGAVTRRLVSLRFAR